MNGLLVKWTRHLPFMEKTQVRLLYRSPRCIVSLSKTLNILLRDESLNLSRLLQFICYCGEIGRHKGLKYLRFDNESYHLKIPKRLELDKTSYRRYNF